MREMKYVKKLMDNGAKTWEAEHTAVIIYILICKSNMKFSW